MHVALRGMEDQLFFLLGFIVFYRLSFPHLVCNGTNDIWYICVLYHSALYIYVTLIL
jgi:hypothetical protein